MELQKKKKKEKEKKKRDFRPFAARFSFPGVGLGDVSELLLDRISVDVDEAEGFRRGRREAAPFRRVPTAGSAPHRVHARGLDLLDGLLDRIEAAQQRRVRLGKRDVQQLLVVVFVRNHFEVRGIRSEENHFDGFERVSRPRASRALEALERLYLVRGSPSNSLNSSNLI